MAQIEGWDIPDLNTMKYYLHSRKKVDWIGYTPSQGFIIHSQNQCYVSLMLLFSVCGFYAIHVSNIEVVHLQHQISGSRLTHYVSMILPHYLLKCFWNWTVIALNRHFPLQFQKHFMMQLPYPFNFVSRVFIQWNSKTF